MDYYGVGIQTHGARVAAATVMKASTSSLAPAFDEGSSNGADVLLQTREWFPRLEPSPPSLPSGRPASPSLLPPTSSSPPPSGLTPPPMTWTPPSAMIPLPPPVARSSSMSSASTASSTVSSTPSMSSASPPHVDRDSDRSRSNNIFEYINTINQAVSIIVAACRGGDVTPEKLHCKYLKIYMALDIVLHGVGSVRLATILSSIHGDNITKMVHTAIDVEIRVHGIDTWSGSAEALSLKHHGNLDTFSMAFFELSPETLAAGDEVAATISPVAASLPTDEQQKDQAFIIGKYYLFNW